jgi:hypothetical protein
VLCFPSGMGDHAAARISLGCYLDTVSVELGLATRKRLPLRHRRDQAFALSRHALSPE